MIVVKGWQIVKMNLQKTSNLETIISQIIDVYNLVL